MESPGWKTVLRWQQPQHSTELLVVAQLGVQGWRALDFYNVIIAQAA